MITLLERNFVYYWRDPSYVTSKLALNIAGGLFIGFTFWQATNSQQGIQSKLFVCPFDVNVNDPPLLILVLQSLFMATILCVPLAQQLQIPFIHIRSIYEIRERPSRMYSWTSLVASQILVELPWNMLGSSLFFFCWYWTVGYDSRFFFVILLSGLYFTDCTWFVVVRVSRL
jgi:ATP-binding cassette, subfamily G (WHITE), member 2, SNQ2